MTKPVFAITKRHEVSTKLKVGTIGHMDHGKTMSTVPVFFPRQDDASRGRVERDLLILDDSKSREIKF